VNLHLVAGFLGSGKTTAIIGAAKQHMRQGQRVGVVTNDLGKYLVDTAFSHMAQVPTVEVTGGCFCCHFDEFEKKVDRLMDTVHPDVIFAESIGSCADIVATVIKPLLQLRETLAAPSSFSVFTDIRLLQRRLMAMEMPFSEHVVYIFDKQIEEANLIILNKIDLLPSQQVKETRDMAVTAFPGKTIHLLNALEDESLAGWVNVLEAHTVPLPERSPDIDYRRYGQAKGRLAWLDEQIHFIAPDGQGQQAVGQLAQSIVLGLRRRNIPIGHVKLFVQAGNVEAKISIPALEEAGWAERIPVLPAGPVDILINGAVEAGADTLHEVVKEAQHTSLAPVDPDFCTGQVAYFANHFPEPTHRVD